MEQESVAQGGEPNHLEMEDFMDMVLTYKCKFCEFTSIKPESVGEHVKAEHITTSANVTETIKNSQNILKQSPEKAAQVQEKVLQNSQYITQPAFVEVTDPTNFVASSYISQPNSTSLVVANSSKDTGSGLVVSTVDQSRTFATQTLGQSESARTVNQINIDFPSLPVSSTQNMESISLPGQQVTRELFLCGQCSIGFNNVDDCKLHLINAHNAVLRAEDEVTNSERETNPVINLASEKISVGTQADIRKKPGRKQKSQTEAQTNLTGSSYEEENDAVSETRSRSRHIKIPRSMKQEYVFTRPKVRSREKGHLKSYTLRCDTTGCSAHFKTQTSLDIHKSCHRVDNYGFECIECKQVFTKWREMRAHLWRTHKIDTDLLACEICAFKTDALYKLKIHKQIHSEDRAYKCSLCEKSFKQLSQMHNHMPVHTASVQQISLRHCDICERTFKTPKCLAKHIEAVHSKVKVFSCTFCPYTATRKAMLVLHLRTHTGEKPFKCSECQYVTADHNSLRRHKMRHSGQKQYKCQYCPYSCIQAISLKCHMKNKHPGLAGIYSCNLCQYRTVNKTNFDQHIREHDLGSVPVAPMENDPPSSEQTTCNDMVPIVTLGTSEDTSVPMEATEAQISREDLAKLTANYEGLVPSDVNAAQLIYSALNAMSQNMQPTSSQASTHILEGVQTTISEQAEEGGVTTHTITFHLAAPEETVATTDTNQLLASSEPVLLTHALQVIQKDDATETMQTVSVPYCPESNVQIGQQE